MSLIDFFYCLHCEGKIYNKDGKWYHRNPETDKHHTARPAQLVGF